jgi:hypothetical protein
MIQRQKITSYVSRTSQTNTLALPIDNNNNNLLYIFLIYGVFINKVLQGCITINTQNYAQDHLLSMKKNNIHNNKSVQKTT